MDCMNSGLEDADLRIVVDLCRKGVDLRKERSSSRSVVVHPSPSFGFHLFLVAGLINLGYTTFFFLLL
ncbi:hypothetical protein Tsubulata_006491 [Turnera subulata]|uniref:Uncharacterized protein n=1 Tax=Turnera subulata TaxID=218843 RepID=A0A9Q0G5R5_9ROSI|nr:hypothetical protein Tsubulata_006491 [Turnera subulata]